MRRFNINDIVNLALYQPPAVYKNQVAVITTLRLAHFDVIKKLFSIDAFAIGYVLKGHSTTYFNNTPYSIQAGDIFILAPTHICQIPDCSPDYRIRLLLLDANVHNMSVHLNYIVKSERWTQSYFNPVIRLNADEAKIISTSIDRIVEQITRPECPNKSAILRLAVTWHHVELDNIMQKHENEIKDNNRPLTRQQALARQLYLLLVNNYRKEHQTKFYSEQMCLTPQYLNQIAVNVFRKTLSALISSLLYSTARAMILASDMSIQEIADELNFPDQASFSKFIKKTAGVSPNNLRKMNPHQEII